MSAARVLRRLRTDVLPRLRGVDPSSLVPAKASKSKGKNKNQNTSHSSSTDAFFGPFGALPSSGSSSSASVNALTADAEAALALLRAQLPQAWAAAAETEEGGAKARRAFIADLFLLVADSGKSAFSIAQGTTGTAAGERENLAAARGWAIWSVLIPLLDVNWFREASGSSSGSSSGQAGAKKRARDGAGALGSTFAELFMQVLVADPAFGRATPAQAACSQAVAEWVLRGGCWADVKRDTVAPVVSRVITLLFRLCALDNGLLTESEADPDLMAPSPKASSPRTLVLLLAIRRIVAAAPLPCRGSVDQLFSVVLSVSRGPQSDGTACSTPNSQRSGINKASGANVSASLLRHVLSEFSDEKYRDSAAATVACLASVSSVDVWNRVMQSCISEINSLIHAWLEIVPSTVRFPERDVRLRGQKSEVATVMPTFFAPSIDALSPIMLSSVLPQRIRSSLLIVSFMLRHGLGLRGQPSCNTDSLLDLARTLVRTALAGSPVTGRHSSLSEWAATLVSWSVALLEDLLSVLKRQLLPRCRSVCTLSYIILQLAHGNVHFGDYIAQGSSARCDIALLGCPSLRTATLTLCSTCITTFGVAATTVWVIAGDARPRTRSGLATFADACTTLCYDTYVSYAPMRPLFLVTGTQLSAEPPGHRSASGTARKTSTNHLEEQTSSSHEFLLSESELGVVHGRDQASASSRAAFCLLDSCLENSGPFLSSVVRSELDSALILCALRCEAIVATSANNAGTLTAASQAAALSTLRSVANCLALSASVPVAGGAPVVDQKSSFGNDAQLVGVPSVLPLTVALLSRYRADNAIGIIADAGWRAGTLSAMSSVLLGARLDSVLHPPAPPIVPWSSTELASLWQDDVSRRKRMLADMVAERSESMAQESEEAEQPVGTEMSSDLFSDAVAAVSNSGSSASESDVGPPSATAIRADDVETTEPVQKRQRLVGLEGGTAIAERTLSAVDVSSPFETPAALVPAAVVSLEAASVSAAVASTGAAVLSVPEPVKPHIADSDEEFPDIVDSDPDSDDYSIEALSDE